MYVAPVVPQIAGALTFLAGTVLLVLGRDAGDQLRASRSSHRFLPLAVLEVSHLAGERHRPRAARAGARAVPPRPGRLSHHLLAARRRHRRLPAEGAAISRRRSSSRWCSACWRSGGAPSTARRRFCDERFTPAWVASIVGRDHRWRSGSASSPTATCRTRTSCGGRSRCDANAPRMLRASLAVIVLATAYLLLNLLRPARPEPAVAERRGPRARARHRSTARTTRWRTRR